MSAEPPSQVDYSENNDTRIISLGVIFIVLAFLSVVARLWSKLSKHIPITSDDTLLVVAFIFSLGETILLIKSIDFANLGRHTRPDETHYYVGLGKGIFAAGLIQPCILYFSKLSILILLHRIFITRVFRLTILILIGISTAWFVATWFADLLICLPIESHWEGTSKCARPQAVLDIATPIPWILTDFAILVAPIPMVRQLHLPRHQKIGIICLFLIGTATCIITIFRYLTLFYDIDDLTYDIAGVAIWNMIEADITIICSALVAAKPAFAFILPRALLEGGRRRWSWHHSSRSRRTGSGSRSGEGHARPRENDARQEMGGDFQRLPSETSGKSVPLTHVEITESECEDIVHVPKDVRILGSHDQC